MSKQKKLWRSKFPIALALFVAFFMACNTTDEKSGETTDQSSTNTGTAPPTPAAASIGNFQFLALADSIVHDFFSPTGKKCSKIVLRFIYDEDAKIVVAEAFGAKKNDKKFILPPTALEDLKAGINLGKKLKLGDVELTKQMYKALPAQPNGTTHLIFFPMPSSQTGEVFTNSVVYKVQWGNAASFKALTKDQIAALSGQELNPSPPADPCLSGDCED